MNNSLIATVDLESHEDQVDAVFHELDLALKWKRPSIIFAIYNSGIVRSSAQNALEDLIYKSGQSVIHYQVEYDKDLSISQFIEKTESKSNSVFYIDPLNSENNNSEIASLLVMLEYFRGYVVENLVRVVLWLTEHELLKVAHNAPDFWASRHRVFEFIDNNFCVAGDLGINLAVQDSQPENIVLTSQGKLSDSDISSESKCVLFSSDKSDPSLDGINLLLMLGADQWQKGYFDQACNSVFAALAIAEETSNYSNQVMCLNALSLIYAEAGHNDEAIQAYRRILTIDPKNYDGWKNLGAAYLKTGFSLESLEAYKNALGINSEDPVTWNGIGNVNNKLGDIEESIRCYRKSIKLDANYLSPWENLADLLLSQNRNNDALYAFMRIVEMDKKNIHAWTEIGNIYLKAGSYEQAIDAYKKALVLGVDTPALQMSLAGAYVSIGKYSEAISSYKSIIEKDVELVEKSSVIKKMGEVYHLMNEHEKALSAFDLAEKLLTSPDEYLHVDVALLVNKFDIVAMVSEVEHQDAAPDILVEQVSDGNEVVNQSESDEVIVETVQYEEPVSENVHSLSNSSNLVETKNDTAIVWIRLAGTYMKAGATDRAIGAYLKAVEIDPTNRQVYMWLAQAYEDKNDYVESIKNYKKKLEFEETGNEKAVTYSKIADLYRRMKDYLSALEAYETALQFEPQNELILDGLSIIQNELDAKQEEPLVTETPQLSGNSVEKKEFHLSGVSAKAEINLAVSERFDIAPDLKNTTLWNDMGIILTKSNSYIEAEQAFRKAIEYHPENGWAFYNLGVVLTRQGRYEEAVVVFHQSIEFLKVNADKAMVWNSLGDIYRQAGRYTDAIEAYQNADRVHQSGKIVSYVRDSNEESSVSRFIE